MKKNPFFQGATDQLDIDVEFKLGLVNDIVNPMAIDSLADKMKFVLNRMETMEKNIKEVQGKLSNHLIYQPSEDTQSLRSSSVGSSHSPHVQSSYGIVNRHANTNPANKPQLYNVKYNRYML